MVMRVALIAILINLCTISYGQLPKNWFGHYKGELTSVNLEGKETSFGMELIIKELTDTTYSFTIIYTGEGVKQERAYQLISKGKGHFLMDENNGIILDMSYGKDRLVSFFEVKGSFLHVSYILEKKGIRFELTSSRASQKTGGTTNEGEEIPEVQSYMTISFQYAWLKRQK